MMYTSDPSAAMLHEWVKEMNSNVSQQKTSHPALHSCHMWNQPSHLLGMEVSLPLKVDHLGGESPVHKLRTPGGEYQTLLISLRRKLEDRCRAILWKL